MDDTNLVLLTTYFDPGTAHIARGFLESHDIPCFIFDDQIAQVAWHLQIGTGGARLMVPQALLEDARALLLEHQMLPGGAAEKPLLPQSSKGLLAAFIGFVMTIFSGVPFILKNKDKQ